MTVRDTPKVSVLPAGVVHGTRRAFNTGCHCDPCRRARTAHCKQLELRRRTGRLSPTQRVDASAAIAHLRAVMAAVPRASVNTAALATGIESTAVIKSLLAGQRRHSQVSTVQAVLALTPDKLAAALQTVPIDQAYEQSSRLRAAGYPLSWQARQTGRAIEFWYRRHAPMMTVAFARDVKELYDRVGWRPATVADGLQPEDITRTRNLAAAAGWKPSFCYDDSGEFMARAMPDHPWSLLDRRAERRIDVARGVLAGEDRGKLAERLEVSDKEVERTAKRIGVYATNPDSAQNAVRQAAILDRYDHGDADPIVTALDMGLLTPRSTWAGHPGYDEWVARQSHEAAA